MAVERKVKAATGGASALTLVAAVISALLYRYVFPKNMDPIVETEIVAAIPAVVAGAGAFLAGYFAKHTHRPDVPITPPPAPPAPAAT